MLKSKYIKRNNREISWLSFNERVLQEAADKRVPLLERLKFLAIFSSNLDEFFRVRVATVKRMKFVGRKSKKLLGDNPEHLLKEIHSIVIKQKRKFNEIYKEIQEALESEGIFFVNEEELTPEQGEFVKAYFNEKVLTSLVPIMIDNVEEFPDLKDKSIYLAVQLLKKNAKGCCTESYAIIEVPTDNVSRFLVLPKQGVYTYVMFLDDVIRYALDHIFQAFEYDEINAYTIKLTRDAELDLDSDIGKSFMQKISKSIERRKMGRPVRFIYDENLPDSFLQYLIEKLHLRDVDNKIPGARYHNFKDFFGFPKVGPDYLRYKNIEPIRSIPQPGESLFKRIVDKDFMLHYPYHSFDYFIDLLREAAIDPKVQSIKITVYRLAGDSKVANALINAIKNGKKVVVVVELQARFDEAANIKWAKKLQDEGAEVIYGIPGLKIHAKLCLITRREGQRLVRYAKFSTGNFNESSAKIYCDDALFTADKRITAEIEKMFSFFRNNYEIMRYRHLLVSPFYFRSRFYSMVNQEINQAKAGKKAVIYIKMNNLVDKKIIGKLYEASMAGVKVKLIIRGICSLIPGVKDLSENIEAISMVDKFLEHSRLMIFHNGGNEKYYISSADLMTRNMDYRVEAACPIYDKDIQKRIKDLFMIQLSDNQKSRIINEKMDNQYIKQGKNPAVRTQLKTYQYLLEAEKSK